MLGRPHRVEAALLQRDGELRRGDRVVGEKDRRAEFRCLAPLPGVRRNPRVCGRHSRWEGMSDNLTPRIEQLAPELGTIISTSEPIEHLADGFGGAQGPAEGPLWWKEGGYLLFSDIHNNRRMKYQPGSGVSLFLEPTNRANGLTRDLQGRLVACEHDGRRVTRQEADGSITDPWSSPAAPEQ